MLMISDVKIRDWRGIPVKPENAPPGTQVVRHTPTCPKCETTDVKHSATWLERYGDYHSKVWRCQVCQRVFLVNEPNDAPGV